MADERSIDVRTIEPRVPAADAVDRTKRMTLGRFLRTRFAEVVGREDSPKIYTAYYPDYLAYTTVTLYRYVGGDREIKFLAGIDAITGRVGEVDVELPERRFEGVDPATVLEPTLNEEEVATVWREWLWKYLDRKYRPVKRPESSLDDLELVHVPYWIVDYGTKADSFVVSALTRQAEHVEAIGPLAAYYDEALS